MARGFTTRGIPAMKEDVMADIVSLVLFCSVSSHERSKRARVMYCGVVREGGQGEGGGAVAKREERELLLAKRKDFRDFDLV